jgi:hypothetical protein
VTFSYILVLALIVLLLLSFAVPMRCEHPIGRTPFRGCRRTVYGFHGTCGSHGRRAQARYLVALGGRKLMHRRVCANCGRAKVFIRFQNSGKPYLGCTGYPNCKSPRLLDTYTF